MLRFRDGLRLKRENTVSKPCHAFSQAPLWHPKFIQTRLKEPTSAQCFTARQLLVPWSPFSLRSPEGWQRSGASPSPRGRCLHTPATTGHLGREAAPEGRARCHRDPELPVPGRPSSGHCLWGRGVIICGVFSSPTMAFHGRCIVPGAPALFLRVHQFSFTCHGAGSMEKGKEGKGGGEEGQTQPHRSS